MNVKLRIFFLCGQLGMMMLARYFFQWIMHYSRGGTSGVILFSAGLVGIVLLFFRVFDAVTDPMAGAFSDYCVKKGIERRRLLLYSFLVPGVGLALCFAADPSMSGTLRWGLLVSGMFVFFVGYTFFAIPYWSLVEDYSAGSNKERTHLSTLLGVGMILATAVGFAVSPKLVDSLGYFQAAIIFAIVGTALMILPYFAKPAAIAEGSETSAASQLDSSAPSVRQAFFEGLKHRRLLAILAIFSGSQMSLTIMTAAVPFVATDLLGGSEKDVIYLTGPLLGLSLPAFILVPWLSRRFGWERAIVGASLLLGLCYCFAALVGQPIVGSPLLTASIIFGFGGPMIAVLLGLEGEAVCACAREKGDNLAGIYFGITNLIVKTMNGVAIMIAGIFTDLSTGPLGSSAIRGMTVAAGVSLFLGAGVYWYLQHLEGRKNGFEGEAGQEVLNAENAI